MGADEEDASWQAAAAALHNAAKLSAQPDLCPPDPLLPPPQPFPELPPKKAAAAPPRKDVMLLGRFFRGRQSKVHADRFLLSLRWPAVAVACALDCSTATKLAVGCNLKPAASPHLPTLLPIPTRRSPSPAGPRHRHRRLPADPAVAAARRAAAPHRQPHAQPHRLFGGAAHGGGGAGLTGTGWIEGVPG